METSKSQKLSSSELPEDIMREIMSRLPVKSLLRFKSVSKSFNSLISCADFIKAHRLTRSSSPGSDNVILMNYHSEISFWDAHKPDSFLCLNLAPGDNFWVHGCCDGLVCFSTRRDNQDGNITLLNPSTKQSKKITRPEGFTMFGFGYDCLAEDYKVVGIAGLEEHWLEKKVWVYELKKGLWRRINDFPGGIISDDSAKYVKGRLNWIVRTTRINIVSLDLAKEVFSEVQLPSDAPGESTPTFERSLGVVEDCLGMFCNYSGIGVDVWVMREHGKVESWSKLFSIPYTNITNYLKPLFFFKNGDVLVEAERGKSTYVYDRKEKKFKNPVIHHLFGCFQFEESLASPNAKNKIAAEAQIQEDTVV